MNKPYTCIVCCKDIPYIKGKIDTYPYIIKTDKTRSLYICPGLCLDLVVDQLSMQFAVREPEASKRATEETGVKPPVSP